MSYDINRKSRIWWYRVRNGKYILRYNNIIISKNNYRLRPSESREERKHPPGCADHSTRGGMRDFQSCTDSVLYIRFLELYQDHHHHSTPSRPFMPEMTLINQIENCAYPTRLRDERRGGISAQLTGTKKSERTIWFLHIARIISCEIDDPCSNL